MFAEYDVNDDNFPKEDVKDIEYNASDDIIVRDTDMTPDEIDFTVPSFNNLIQHVKNNHKSRINESVDPYKVEGVGAVLSSVANIFGQMGGTHEVHVHATGLKGAQMFVAAPPAFLSSPGVAATTLLTHTMAQDPPMQESSTYIYDLDDDDFDVDPSAHVEDPGDDSI